MKTILVTGGAGFLGSFLCERLLGEGHHVVCLDNLQTGSLRNIDTLLPNGRFTFMPHDIVQPVYLNFAVDEIYHLACPASPPQYQADPIRTLKTSVLGSMNMLGLAKQWNARIMLASTSEVYGDPLVHPQSESYHGNVNPTGPRACYDEGKRCAETLFFDYYRQHGVRIKVVRIFNTYGPRMHEQDGRVVSNFITQALKGHNLTVYGDGSQTRSFCYVDDLIEGFIRMMHSPDDFVGPLNLGNPGEFTVQALADKVIRQTGSTSQITRKPLPKDDPARRRPDITLAGEKLGWKPTVPLEEGLKRTIAYFQTLLKEGG
ncbi:UDP-glucuronic acid decarboxylase family protein [Paenibacillus cremeus]|uniref:UDP-glucuronate decarboxylase n=1 Tax=Paenibacillus cremeus TaxID=2163881 RepID=A0A559KIS4_9BACL|nr:UDP-glucuronic acid decarboxylase family protein [Paenibacillus cremeus]TVY12034.1 SDR family oxidoreductase [Paenibacillus cremeus]